LNPCLSSNQPTLPMLYVSAQVNRLWEVDFAWWLNPHLIM
jgi:hypothetical protein